MSSHDLGGESLAALQVLSLDSTLQLTRRLASALNKHNGDTKATHLKIYEGLLSKKPNEDLDQNEILSLCIQSSSKDEGTLDKLLSLIGQLSGLESGREIVQFLALMGKKKTERTKEQKTRFFSCPREMLDGSLFTQPPRDDGPSNFYKQSFGFSDLPGTNLPLCFNFLNLRNDSPPKAVRKDHNDQGYSSSEDSEVDWVAVSKMEPLPPHRTWEQLGELQPAAEKPLLTDVCSFEAHKSQLSRKEFLTHVSYLLVGIPSDSFPYSEETKGFFLAKDLRVIGVSPMAVAEMVKPMIACGTSHFHLNKFVNGNDRSKIIQAIQKAVRNLLLLHSKSVQNLVSGNEDRIVGMVNCMHWVGPPLVGVSSFCCPPTGKKLKGLAALEELSRISSEVMPGRIASVFYSLLKAAAEAYLRILWAWIFDGELPEDKKSEFFIQAQPGILNRRDRAFWADSFVILENRVPSFLKGLETSVKQCGIALSFLKLCRKNHPLLSLRNRPSVVCCLNDAELERLKTQCSLYEKEAIEVCGAPVTAAEQLEINQEQQQAFLAMVAQVREEKLAELRAALIEERKRTAEKRRKLKEELAQQIEEAKARKAEQLRKEREEEEKFAQELKELQEKQLKMLAEEKERIRRHYADYLTVPEDKVATAEAEIQGLRDELDQLNASIKLDEEVEAEDVVDSFSQDITPVVDRGNLYDQNDENKNPIEVTVEEPTPEPAEPAASPDDNANLNQRMVPTSLAINKMDNSAANEAAKNRARVLSHEFNLIQNYDECDSVRKPTATTPDNQDLSEMFRKRADEAARNRARVMQHEFFSNEVDNRKKETLDNKLLVVDSPMTPDSVQMISSNEFQSSTSSVFIGENAEVDQLDTPDSQPSAMSISSEASPNEAPAKPFPASASNYSMSSMLSALSEPRRWPSTCSRESVNSYIRENSQDSNTHIKNSFLQHTVSIVLHSQVQLANKYVLHIFLHELSVLSHFRSLRNFFLLLDGEFGARLTAKLCHEVEAFQDKPESLLTFASMNYILQNILAGCEDPNKERLSLGFRTVPKKFNSADSNLLGCFQLQYEVSWPLNSVLTRQVMQMYDLLSTFLLGLRRTVWVLDQTFRYLKTCDQGINKKMLNNSPQHRSLCLHLFEMSAFFRAFHSYVMNVAIVQQWPKCEEALKKVSSLDALYEVHYRMFLKNVVYRCILRKEAAQIQELLGAAIRPVLRFYSLLTSHPWTLKGTVYTHPQFKSLSLEYKKYHERTNLLAKNLSKLATRGYQSDLQDLCDYLRMNDFYSVLNVEPQAPSSSMASSTTSSLKSR